MHWRNPKNSKISASFAQPTELGNGRFGIGEIGKADTGRGRSQVDCAQVDTTSFFGPRFYDQSAAGRAINRPVEVMRVPCFRGAGSRSRMVQFGRAIALSRTQLRALWRRKPISILPFLTTSLLQRLVKMRLIKPVFQTIGFGACLLASAAAAQQPLPKPSPARPAAAQPGPATQSQISPAPPQAAPQPSSSAPVVAPQRTTATYDDWIVQCDTLAGPPARKVCEMTQLTQSQVQGRVQPFSRAVVPKPEKDQASILVVQLPVNVTFSVSVKIQSSDSDPGISTSFARCIPDGCFASFEMKDDAIRKFRGATSGGKLSFADASGRVISVPISFNGFGKAYDALLKE